MTDPSRAALLRLEVARLRRDHRRRRFDPVLHVGVLCGDRLSASVPAGDPVLDPGTRLEVVLRLLECGADGGDVWLNRPGEPVVQDDDLAWLAASDRAFDLAGVPLRGVWAVTRTGWLDVRTGDRRTWKRLRVA